MKKKRTKKEITNREMWLGILIAIFGAVIDFCFFGFSYSADPQGEHGEITTASIVLSVIWIALSLAGAFLMSYFLNDRSFLFGFSGSAGFLLISSISSSSFALSVGRGGTQAGLPSTTAAAFDTPSAIFAVADAALTRLTISSMPTSV